MIHSNFKIDVLVDMWLAGFDVPSLDTIYIDKPLSNHTLIQTISQVNRVYVGKEKLLALSKAIKEVVDDKAKYTDWASREDIKAELQVALIMILDEFGYPPVTMDDVFKEVLEQAENFKKNR